MTSVDQLIRDMRRDQYSSAHTGVIGVENIERLIALDRAAHTIRVWSERVISGLLQTPEYSAAIIRAAHPRLPHHEVEERVLRKEHRARSFLHRVLTRELDGSYYVIGERAIYSKPASLSDADYCGQLQHLVELSGHAKIQIQVLPDRVVPSALAADFLLHGLSDGWVGYQETVMGGCYSAHRDVTDGLMSVFSDLGSTATSPTKSREAIEAWLRKRRESTARTEESSSSSAPTAARATSALASPEQPRAPWRMERG